MSKLTWSALFLAALAAVAWWNPEDRPACDGSRPVIGARVCCERHRADESHRGDGISQADFEAAFLAGPGPLARP